MLGVGQPLFQDAAPLLGQHQLTYVSRKYEQAWSGTPRDPFSAHFDWEGCAVLAAVGTAQREWPSIARLLHDVSEEVGR